MSALPETQKEVNDLIDVIIKASHNVEEVRQEDGSMAKQLVMDPESIWWKTGLINSPTFGRFAYILKEWERQATDALDNMYIDRAIEIGRDILDIGKSFRRSIDAKSSESLRDKYNTQATLIDKLIRKRVEKAYTVKGAAKRSMIDGIIGRDQERDQEYD